MQVLDDEFDQREFERVARAWKHAQAPGVSLNSRDHLLEFIRANTNTEVQRQLMAYHDFYAREGERYLDAFREPGACLAESAINQDQQRHGRFLSLQVFLLSQMSLFVQQAAKLAAIGKQDGMFWRPTSVTVDLGKRRREYYNDRAGRHTAQDILDEAQMAFSVSFFFIWIDPAFVLRSAPQNTTADCPEKNVDRSSFCFVDRSTKQNHRLPETILGSIQLLLCGSIQSVQP